jgi:hypothetical protein
MKRNILILLTLFVVLASFTLMQDQKPWPVPDKYA